MRKTLPAFRELRRCEGGLAAIEFAMIALPMMMTLLGLIEFGRGLYLYNRISHVADLATRRVLTHPDTADQVLTDQISAEFSRHEAAPVITIASGSVGTGTSATRVRTITISSTFIFLVPTLTTDRVVLQMSRRVPLIP